jgi:hypothetical protein
MSVNTIVKKAEKALRVSKKKAESEELVDFSV